MVTVFVWFLEVVTMYFVFSSTLMVPVRTVIRLFFDFTLCFTEGLTDQPLLNLHTEYGDLRMSVEVVDSVDRAVEYINTNGSGHTECIISENSAVVDFFMKRVD